MLSRSKKIGSALLGVFGLVTAQPGFAHTPYLLPTNFAVTKDHVTLEAAMTGEVFFVPEMAIRSNSFSMTDPDGATSELKGTAFKDLVVVEAPIGKDGTYRIATDVPGRATKMAKVDGTWQMVRSPQPQGAAAPQRAERPVPQGQNRPRRGVDEASLPKGTKIIEVHSVSQLETYVTKGAPSPVKTSGKGFELKPVTHPNEIFIDQGFSFVLQFDGKPVKGVEVDVFRGGNAYDDKKVVTEVKTGSKGEVDLSFDRPGVYVLTARYPERGEANVEPASKTYSYSLSFEVAP